MKKFIIFFLCARFALGADFYLRPDGYASGTNAGTSWTNAWKGGTSITWASVSAGDTIWMAGSPVDGNYTTSILVGGTTKSGTLGSRILIRRVLSTDAVPVAAAGWNALFDSQVVLGNDVNFSWISGNNGIGSYFTVDGRAGDWRTGAAYGIKQLCTSGGSGSTAYGPVYCNTGHTGVIIQYVEGSGPGGSAPYNYGSDVVGMNFTSTGPYVGTSIINCSLHGYVNLIKMDHMDSLTVTNTDLYDVNNDPSGGNLLHPNVIYSVNNTGTNTFTNNRLSNWDSEGILCQGTQTWILNDNIFRNTVGTTGGTGGAGRIISSESGGVTSLTFYQNTCYNITQTFQVSAGGTYSAGSKVRNSIFYLVGTIAPTSSPSDVDYSFSNSAGIGGAHSISSGSDPFVSGATGNFNIIAGISSVLPRNKGVTGLGVANDIVGNAFASPPSIGAYEYFAGGTTGGSFLSGKISLLGGVTVR